MSQQNLFVAGCWLRHHPQNMGPDLLSKMHWSRQKGSVIESADMTAGEKAVQNQKHMHRF